MTIFSTDCTKRNLLVLSTSCNNQILQKSYLLKKRLRPFKNRVLAQSKNNIEAKNKKNPMTIRIIT